MAHRRQQWWNSFGFESKFKQRQIARVVVFALAYVAISTVCMAAVYATILGPLARGEMPLMLRLEVLRDTGGGIPGMTETIVLWATLMTSLSVFFAVVVGLYFSHKLAGPLYRFKLELGRLAAGEATRSVQLRKGDDDFQDIADALNEVLARLDADGSASHRLESADAKLAELRSGVLRHLNDPEALRRLVEKAEA